MWHNYVTVALRTLSRNRVFSAINILGLAVGMAASLLIFQYVSFERSYDAFHPDADDIYRIQLNAYQQGKLAYRSATSYPAIAPALEKEFPEVAETARLLDMDNGVVTYDRVQYRENNFYFADNSVFAVFHLPFVKGDPRTALRDPNAVVLSESTARKYFGTANPLGKTLRLGNDPYQVKGVFKDYPNNAHLELDLLFSFPKEHEEASTNWGWYDFFTYVKLRPGTDPDKFGAKVKNLVMRHSPGREHPNRAELFLQPLRSIHLHSDLNQEAEANGNGRAVDFLLIIAFFILAIAWINYINLATARAVDRAKEVGVRKAIGALRQQLVGQFLAESLLLNLVAVVVAMAMVWLALPAFNQLTGRALDPAQWLETPLWLPALLTFAAGSLLAGVYPAFVLSGFRPVAVLKGRLRSTAKGLALRQALIVFQFAASVLLIVGTLTVYKQLRYMQNQTLGFNADQTLVVRSPGVIDSTYGVRAGSFKQELANAGIAPNVTASTYVPGIEILWTSTYRSKGPLSQGPNTLYINAVDESFLDAFGIELAAGRNFSPDFGTDRKGVLLNETAARLLGFRSPEEALNQEVYGGRDTTVVVGVVRDYHQLGLQRAHWPMLFRYLRNMQADAAQFYSLKVPARDLDQTLAAIKGRYDQFFPGNPFEYFFLDTFFNEQYKAEQQFGRVFGLFAGLAVLIAALGLFGLISFTAVRRTREIGIRKVMGASVPGIVLLLSKDFLKLVGIAIAVAVPLAWHVMENWLADFAYRTEVGAGVLALAGLLALLIALLTVSFQAFKAAGTNPVKALRTE
jgi:putative ABC transport system permease protein